MSNDGLTGPVQISAEDKQKFYHRVKDICHMLLQRKLAIAVHPKWKGLMADMQEEMMEDPTWPHKEAIPVVVTWRVKDTDIMAFDPVKGQPITLTEANGSGAGFGRFDGLRIPQGSKLHDIDWTRKRPDR